MALKFTLGNPENIRPTERSCIPHQRFINQENINAIERNILRESFGNSSYNLQGGDKLFATGRVIISKQDGISNFNPRLTPFRVAMNAGDIAGEYQKANSVAMLPKPANQVRIGSLRGWKRLAGSVNTIVSYGTDEIIGSFYTGNPTYVYDGADYVRFKKLQAINKNYNDPTFGGDKNRASQSAYRRTH